MNLLIWDSWTIDMKMKTLVIYLILASSLSAAIGRIKLKFKVIDQDGVPVEGAQVDASGDNDKKYLTDEDGMVEVSIRKTFHVLTGCRKEGFYTSSGPELYPLTREEDQGITHVIVIKEIFNPIPMYARDYYICHLNIPVNNREVGFDLEKGDWVSPYGQGETNDLLFKFEGTRRMDFDRDIDFFQKISITFSNEKDGLIPYTVEEGYGSDLVSNHLAPENGYLSHWEQTSSAKVGEIFESSADLNRNYYIRVRTKLDKDGNIVSANYGKFYGDFMRITYYFNPTSNDRNIEFDRRNNLFVNQDDSYRTGRP